MKTNLETYSYHIKNQQYAYRIKYGGKVCKICGMFSNLRNYKCTKCYTSFKELFHIKEIESLSLEYCLFD